MTIGKGWGQDRGKSTGEDNRMGKLRGGGVKIIRIGNLRGGRAKIIRK